MSIAPCAPPCSINELRRRVGKFPFKEVFYRLSNSRNSDRDDRSKIPLTKNETKLEIEDVVSISEKKKKTCFI